MREKERESRAKSPVGPGKAREKGVDRREGHTDLRELSHRNYWPLIRISCGVGESSHCVNARENASNRSLGKEESGGKTWTSG